MMFELQLVILRLAYETFPKDLEKKDLGTVMDRYLKFLYLRKNTDLQTSPLP